MVVSCGMPAGGPLWWQAPADSCGAPWALAVETDPDAWKVPATCIPHEATLDSLHEASHEVRIMQLCTELLQVRGPPVLQIDVREGDSAEQLHDSLGGSPSDTRAVYELTAVIAHVRDADEPPGDAATADGHLLAHIKVRKLVARYYNQPSVPLSKTFLSAMSYRRARLATFPILCIVAQLQTWQPCLKVCSQFATVLRPLHAGADSLSRCRARRRAVSCAAVARAVAVATARRLCSRQPQARPGLGHQHNVRCLSSQCGSRNAATASSHL